jgi:hypothetical protein
MIIFGRDGGATIDKLVDGLYEFFWNVREISDGCFTLRLEKDKTYGSFVLGNDDMTDGVIDVIQNAET